MFIWETAGSQHVSHQHGGSSLRVGHVSPEAMLPLSYPLHHSGLTQTLPASSIALTFSRTTTYLQGVTSQKSILPPEITFSLLKTWAAFLLHPAGRWAELPCEGIQLCSGGKGTPLSLGAPRDRGLWRGTEGAQGGAEHQSPPTAMAAFIITVSWVKLLAQVKGCPGTEQAGLGGCSQLLFTSTSNSVPRAPQSTQNSFCFCNTTDPERDSCSSTAAPAAEKTHNCRLYKEVLVHFSHHFQWLWLSTDYSYSLPFILRSQIAH